MPPSTGERLWTQVSGRPAAKRQNMGGNEMRSYLTKMAPALVGRHDGLQNGLSRRLRTGVLAYRPCRPDSINNVRRRRSLV